MRLNMKGNKLLKTVKKHLREDSKVWKKIAKKATIEAKDDKKLIKKIKKNK